MNAVIRFSPKGVGRQKNAPPWDFPHACMGGKALDAEVGQLELAIRRGSDARKARGEERRGLLLRSAAIAFSGLALSGFNEIGNTVAVCGGALAASTLVSCKLENGRAACRRDAFERQKEELELARSFAEVAGAVTRKRPG